MTSERRPGRLLAALDRFPGNLSRLLDDWDSFDLGLREHYVEEVEWLLNAVLHHPDVLPIDLEQARWALAPLADRIEQLMGFRPEHSLDRRSDHGDHT